MTSVSRICKSHCLETTNMKILTTNSMHTAQTVAFTLTYISQWPVM